MLRKNDYPLDIPMMALKLHTYLQKIKAIELNLENLSGKLSTWKPVGPYCPDSKDLLEQLRSASKLLDEKFKDLERQEKLFLLEEEINNPIAVHIDQKHRIETLNRIINLAYLSELREFVRYISTVPENFLKDLKKDKLAELKLFLKDVPENIQNAEQKALQFAHRGTKEWNRAYRRFLLPDILLLESFHLEFKHLLNNFKEQQKTAKDKHLDMLKEKIAPKLYHAMQKYLDEMRLITKIINNSNGLIKFHRIQAEEIGKIWEESEKALSFTEHPHPKLGIIDYKIATEWAKDKQVRNRNFWKAVMESARGAELVALKIYKSLYGSATDLSVMQIKNPIDSRWKYADIETGNRLIDVKNALSAFSNSKSVPSNRYTEHYVKRYKEAKDGSEVSISGILWPYPDKIGDKYLQKAKYSVLWLGETSADTIKLLNKEFESNYFKLNLSKENKSLLPPWIFDYPKEVYMNRDKVLKNLVKPDFAFPSYECPISVGVLAKRLPISGSGELFEEANKLSIRINKYGNYLTRPRLYLHILDRFCQSVIEDKNFPASSLKEILYPETFKSFPSIHNRKTPLGILDPVEIVYELLNILDDVSNHCQLKKYGFKSFKLVGNAIFRGVNANGKLQTITAYCGGWLPNNQGRCGKSSLYLGLHEVCQICGYLICDRCYFCQEKCHLCLKRQSENFSKRTSSFNAPILSDFNDSFEF